MENSNSQLNVRKAPQQHLYSFVGDTTITMTERMVDDIEYQIGEPCEHSRSKKVWHCEAYSDDESIVVPFTVNWTIKQCWVSCMDEDKYHVIDACTELFKNINQG